MSEPHFIIVQLGDGYDAISNMHGRFTSVSLLGFGSRIRDEMRLKFGVDSVDVEFSPCDLLRAKFVECGKCRGTSRVESNATAGQYLGDEFGSIDWSLKATEVCPTCAGLGVEIPGFWQTTCPTA